MKQKYQLILDTINRYRKNRSYGLKEWEEFIIFVCERELGLKNSVSRLDPEYEFFDETRLSRIIRKIEKYEKEDQKP